MLWRVDSIRQHRRSMILLPPPLPSPFILAKVDLTAKVICFDALPGIETRPVGATAAAACWPPGAHTKRDAMYKHEIKELAGTARVCCVCKQTNVEIYFVEVVRCLMSWEWRKATMAGCLFPSIFCFFYSMFASLFVGVVVAQCAGR